MPKLPLAFYRSPDVLRIGRQLLGKFLVTRLDGRLAGGMIVETEAYAGPEDRASHAYGNRRTARTDVMFWNGGVAYVYLCYGLHCLFNIVTGREGVPHAVLIRALQPVDGVEAMMQRRRKTRVDRTLAGGPGSLTRALGIRVEHSGMDLRGARIWLEDRGVRVPLRNILAGPRVGVEYAGAHARRPWRFRIRANPWTSPA
ncbi:MAG: DNA-3-methyladenine glycosylase [Lentisphaerae bacterium]|nr:DNA-3-methyladenine glycosylase [Lentisphaerota bacterium]